MLFCFHIPAVLGLKYFWSKSFFRARDILDTLREREVWNVFNIAA